MPQDMAQIPKAAQNGNGLRRGPPARKPEITKRKREIGSGA
jgi:hypothetical protein